MAKLRTTESRGLIERLFEIWFAGCAYLSVFVTFGIFGILIWESVPFFQQVSLAEFLGGREWTPLFSEPRFGVQPLVLGTLMTTLIACGLAIPMGILVACGLSEFLGSRARTFLKPILEVLAGIPSVIFGYFALLVVTPLFQKWDPEYPGFSLLAAGVTMSFMILPLIVSLTEESLQAVPSSLREASRALGATQWETIWKVVLPSASSGVISASILGVSRALGETMVVALAAGQQPHWTLNPTEPAATMTAYMVQVALGDLPHGSLGYQTVFVVGLLLFLMTFFFNFWAMKLRQRMKHAWTL
ncbi:MAG: phosphate ABC transporter permease subunit PstC [Bdellovibrionales bacterium]